MRTVRASTAFTPASLTTPVRSGFVIKLCEPYRAKTKGKVERLNGYLRLSFYGPLASRPAQSPQKLDLATANVEVAHWLREVANARIHSTTGELPAGALKREVMRLQALPALWRADITAAWPQPTTAAPAAPRLAAGGRGGADRATISGTASVAGV